MALATAKSVRFKRKHDRTAQDVYNNMIRPKLLLALDDTAQKVVFYARKYHTYINRTGAAENSISWIPAKMRNKVATVVVLAGGVSIATQDWWGRVSFSDPASSVLRVKKGEKVIVNYTKYLEAKGYYVLRHAIEHFRNKGALNIKRKMKAKHIKQPTKYSVTAGALRG